MIYPSGASPQHGRYLVQDPALRAALRLSDGLLEIVHSSGASRPTCAPPAPRRLLIGVGGHLGDAVIATSMLPVLARHFPGVEVGMVLPSWARPAVEGHPSLRWIHSVDHWKTSRARAGFPAKWREYAQSRRRSIADIRSVQYDTAVDLYPYYPNLAVVLWQAGIPVRVGYRSGGCGALYTHATDWRDSSLHTSAQHLQVLSVLDASIVARSDAASLRYDLPPLATATRDRAEAVLAGAGLIAGEFVVIHPGVGESRKAWPVRNWRELTEWLSARQIRVVLTGAGFEDARIAREVATGTGGAVNLCDQLDWPTLRGVVGRARLLIGSDSVAAHVAAAEGTPCVSIMAGMSDTRHWRPLGERVAVVTHAVPCAPCFRSDGCATMACVREVGVGDVLEAAMELVALSDLESRGR